MTRVLLAVSGSIAAFKAATLASDMVKADFEVRVIMTAGGARFINPLTFEALTGNPVSIDVWDERPGSSRMGHLELARWADALVVAPASASTIARLALGFADDMLGAVALACRVPLVIAPAMESAMLEHPATQQHLETLRARAAVIVGPQRGRLASGAEGMGRMEEPAEILRLVFEILNETSDLRGARVLVTAGPTFEPIDPVRFIGNRSSGKMGYAMAREAARRGANVVLVAGPTALQPPSGVMVVDVETADQMNAVVLERVGDRDIVVMAAAVSDFRPAMRAEGKIRRSQDMTLHLHPTSDIAASAVSAAPEAFHVGFALESDNLLDSAREKMRRKGQDMVIGNLISESHDPFGSDANQVVIVTAQREIELPSMPKIDVARRVWDEIVDLRR